MKNYTLSQQYSLVGLDGLDSLHPTVEKKAAVRGIAAAKLLEELLPDGEETDPAQFEAELKEGIERVRRLDKKERNALEKEMASLLEADGTMDEVSDLLACDMNYYTSGVDIQVYRADRELYTGIVERMRAEVLEDGPETMECICLLWLFRECGCLHEVFAGKDLETVKQRMVQIALESPIYRILFDTEFHSGLEMTVKHLLNGKSEAIKNNPYLQGVNLAFPFLERRQSIFIDFVIFNTSVKERRSAVLEFIKSKGHDVEEIKNGTETLLKIDNICYRIFPATVTAAHVPIQGARIVPVYR